MKRNMNFIHFSVWVQNFRHYSSHAVQETGNTYFRFNHFGLFVCLFLSIWGKILQFCFLFLSFAIICG